MQNGIVTLREEELSSGFRLWIRYVRSENISIWKDWFGVVNSMLDELMDIIKDDFFFLQHWVSILTEMQPQICYEKSMDDAQVAEENMSLLQNQWDTAFKEMYTIMHQILSYEDITNVFATEVLSSINKTYDICQICLNLPKHHALSRELFSLYKDVKRKNEPLKRNRETYTSPDKKDKKSIQEWKQQPPEEGTAILSRYFESKGFGFLHMNPGVKEIYFRKEICDTESFREGDTCSFTIDSRDPTGTKAKKVTFK